MNMKFMNIVTLSLILLLQGFMFQNCSQVKVSDLPIASTTSSSTATTSSTDTTTTNVDDLGLHVPTDKSRTFSITQEATKVDLLLIVDNSSSMNEDAVALAGKLSQFFSYLTNSKIDWQMCLTTTNLNSAGTSYNWQGGATGIVLNNSTSNMQAVLTDSVQYLFNTAPTNGDERGIAQAYKHMMNFSNTNCYRNNASFISIVISDEDERSTGDVNYSLKIPKPININTLSGPIELIDRPENYLSEFRKLYPNKNIQAHSIVIPSNDEVCFATQSKYSNVSFGTFYENLSKLTSGTVTSICETDFSTNLKTISTSITALSQQVQLECIPIGALEMIVNPADSAVSYTLTNNMVALSYPPNKNYSITLNYKCQ